MSVAKENVRISITIPKELRDKLQEIAKADNRTLSNYIVTVMQEHLKDKG